MSGSRRNRSEIRRMLAASGWCGNLEKIASLGKPAVGPLFSFLLLEPEMMHRAARALGQTVAGIYARDQEAARNIMRRFMWQMNEESGNIGWGIPAAFAETLVAAPGLAREYGRILNSYIMDLGFDDNYCDHDILRRTCYWAVGRLAGADAGLGQNARPWLVKGLGDQDAICRGMAAWALSTLPPDLMAAPALRALAESGKEDVCEVFEDDRLKRISAADLALRALRQG